MHANSKPSSFVPPNQAQGARVGPESSEEEKVTMDTMAAVLFGTGGLIVVGLVLALLIGWYILSSRAKKLKETT
jgi:hypothetical protein